jgi:competence protein ComFC
MNQLFLDTLYPPLCTSCGKLIRPDVLTLCQSCFRQLSFAPKTAVRSIIEQKQSSVTREALSLAFALWYYDRLSPARNLQQRLKYGGHRRLAVHLGYRLGERIVQCNILDTRFDAAVPVPVHLVRLRERGYNQALEIARGVSKILNIPVEGKTLKKDLLSKSQVKIDHDEREDNLRGAFSIVPDHQMEGKNILLIDDVVTTGATVRNAIETLSSAGVARLGVAVLFAVPLDPI